MSTARQPEVEVSEVYLNAGGEGGRAPLGLVLLVAVLLFFVTSFRVEAAVPFDGQTPVYFLSVGSSCGGLPTINLESKSLSPLQFSVPLAQMYVTFLSSYAPVTINGHSAIAIPIDGSCITALLNLNGLSPITMYFWTSAILSKPPVTGTVSDYSVQEILMLCAAFLAFCGGWLVGR